MSTQFPNFHPSIWQVRVEIFVDKGYPCPWRNAASVINCRDWDEALDESIRQGSEWLEAIHENCEHHYIKYNRTGPGSWIIEVIDAQAICPKKIRVDCEIYAGGEPLQGDDDDLTWYVASYRLVEEFGDSKPEPEPETEPEPEEEIFSAALAVIERLGLETEPEPEPIVIPIPSWDWIETEPDYAVARDFMHYDLLNNLAEPEPETPVWYTEPEPEPDRVAYASVWVSIETPQWSVDGSASFDLPNDAAEAATEIDDLSSRILWKVEDTIGSAPESNQRSSSEFWGQAGG